jgi:uncharacterized membrane protein YfcA
MAPWTTYVLLGLATGTASGFLGIGGGLILIPCLVFFFGLNQHQAQGTSLAVLIPPVGILAAWTYYRAGYVNLKIAGFVCLGFVLGGLLGSRIALSVTTDLLRRIFGGVLAVIGVYMALRK